MGDNHYKVVFSGDLAFDTDIDEVRKNLSDHCHYKPDIIDKILKTPKIVLRRGLNKENANRYKNFFDRLGLLCDVVDETPQAPPAPIIQQRDIQAQKAISGHQCPKCGGTSQHSETCEHCGIIFERYEAAQRRLQGGFSEPETLPVASDSGSFQWRQLLSMRETQVLMLILSVLILRGPLHNFLSLALILIMVGLTAIILFQSSETGESIPDLLYEHCTLFSSPKEQSSVRFPDIPFITLLLMISTAAVFWGSNSLFKAEMISRHAAFLPENAGLFDIILIPVATLFFHIGSGHLWVNMIFLWICGSFVEIHCGKRRLLLIYLLGGILAEVVYLMFCLMAGTWPQLLGSSGAVAAILGVSLTLRRDQAIEFPIPLVSVMTPKWGQFLTIRLNKHVITGLFLLLVSSGTVTTGHSISGHVNTVSGLLFGMLLGKLGEKTLCARSPSSQNPAAVSKTKPA